MEPRRSPRLMVDEGPSQQVGRYATLRAVLPRLLTALISGLIVCAVCLLVAKQAADGSPYINRGRFFTRSSLIHLEREVQEYHRKHGTFPGTLQSIENGRSLLDVWNRPFQYSVTRDQFVIESLGRDGKRGGTGPDCDLSNTRLRPPELALTFPQFFTGRLAQGMIGAAFIA